MDCSARGFPEPVITWMKAPGEYSRSWCYVCVLFIFYIPLEYVMDIAYYVLITLVRKFIGSRMFILLTA